MIAFGFSAARRGAQEAICLEARFYRQPSYGVDIRSRSPGCRAALDLIRAMGWIERDQYIESPVASFEELCRFHDSDYVQALMVVEKTQRAAPQIRSRYNFGINGNPIFPEMFRRAATAFGGTFLAARLLLEELITGGATVLRDSVFLTMRLSGFSAYRMQAFAELYFGLSAHHGDGVEAAFAGDGRALSVSVHEEGRWPYSGVLEDRAWGTARNLPVPPGLNDTEFKLLADGVVLPLSIQ